MWTDSEALTALEGVLSDFLWLEENLLHLARDIFRGTWNLGNLSDLEELNNFSEHNACTWKELLDRQQVTCNIAQRRIQTQSPVVSSQEEIKVAELIWKKFLLLLRLGRLLVRYLSNILSLLSDTPAGSNGQFLYDLSLGTSRLSLSGVMETLGREKAEQLSASLKTFMETESPGSPMWPYDGLTDTPDIRELFWTNLMAPPACPTYYVSWTVTRSRSPSREVSSNGDQGSSGSLLNTLLDHIMVPTPNGPLSAGVSPSLARSLLFEEENPTRYQATGGEPLPPPDTPSTWYDLDFEPNQEFENNDSVGEFRFD